MRDRTSISPRFVRVRTSSGKVVMISAGQGGCVRRTERTTILDTGGLFRQMIFSDSREVILTGRWLQGNSYRTSPTVRAETMSHSYESGRQAMAELGSKQPHELLLMLGGLLAVLLTLATYGIQWVTTPGIAQSQYATVATAVILNVVLGAALWASSAITRKNLMNGAIVAGVITIVLIYFRRRPAQIGGRLSIRHDQLSAAEPYLPWSRHH